ncbi:MAG: hypothetical protein C1943_07780 [Halochromatium sp.]|nr:hypothetical protein [Halochromatium sp.]
MIGLAYVYFLYSEGWFAPWLFDDSFSLEGLAEVYSIQSALSYIIGNNTGPTGRPLSMLTFLLNLQDWDANPAAFRQFNTILHLLNATLVAAITWLIVRAAPHWRQRAPGVAVTLALVWALHPLLVSGVLSAVQRMTLLSGFFVLLGVLGYLVGRQLVERRPRAGLLLILVSVGFGTALAGLSKENGFLLPSFIGLIELSLLSRWQPVSVKYWRAGFHLLLWGPLLVFLGYILTHWSGMQAATEIKRAYTLDERLWSQTVILWDYSRQILVPDIRAMGPFQDDPSNLRPFGLVPLVALILWIGVLGVAIGLRRRYPLLLFGVGLFLIGHLLESTAIPLELYFEHRNYLPSLGLLALPVVAIWRFRRWWQSAVLSVALIGGMALLLSLTLRGWENQEIGVERWVKAHPESLRAMVHKAQWVERYQGLAAAAEFTLQAADRRPHDPEVGAYALAAQCLLPKSLFGPGLFSHLQQTLASEKATPATLTYLEHSLNQRLKGGCPWLKPADLRGVFQGLLDGSPLMGDRTLRSRVLVNIGLLEMSEGDIGAGLTSILQGFRLHRTYQTFTLLVESLLSAHREADARTLMEEFMAYQPRNIVTKAEHRRRVLKAYEAAAEKSAPAETL